MRADRHAPDLALARVVGGLVAARGGRRRSPSAAAMIRSGFRPSNTAAGRSCSPPTSRSAADLDVVEEQLPLLVGAARRGRDLRALEPGRVGVDDRTATAGRGRSLVRRRVRATTSSASASSTPEMKVFWSAQAAAVAVAPARVVDRLWVLVPASGSVIAKAILVVPRPMPRSQRSFCSSVPWRARIAAGDRRRDDDQEQRAAGARRSPRPTAASSVMPSPPPSYSSGMLTPR